MTLADYEVEMNGLAMGGASEDYQLMAPIEGLGMPEIRSTDMARTGDDGDFPGNDYLGGRRLVLTVGVMGDTAAEARGKLQTLATAWSPRRSSMLPLTIKLPGADARRVIGRPRRLSPDLTYFPGGYVEVLLEFVASDPRIYADTESIETTGLPTTDGVEFPIEFPILFPPSSGGLVVATNDGTFPTRPRAVIVGPIVNPRLENLTAGQSVGFALTLGVTDELELDFAERTVILNGSASRRDTLVAGSGWWELRPGTNEIRFDGDTFDPDAAVYLTWRSAWI